MEDGGGSAAEEGGLLMPIPVTVVIPTYNAGEAFRENAEMLLKQTADIKTVLIIDSSSNDSTVAICNDYGFAVEVIPKEDFGHGKTRQYALERADTDIVVFMTQDALLADEYAIEKLVGFLIGDEEIAAVCGRQLPYPNTGALGSFARFFNYPDKSRVNVFADRKGKGIKTAFLSDSFAAYKKTLLMKIGGFPKGVNFGEDMYVAAKFLMSGYKTGYCAEAQVYHSHDYSIMQDYERSKMIGAFHKQEPWLLKAFGKAEGEGVKFVLAEAKWLIQRGLHLTIISAFVHNVVKFIGYKRGL